MNPKDRQKQVARLLVSDSVPIGPAPVRPSSEDSEIRPPVRRFSDDEGEETRDKEKEKEQDEEEKVMREQRRGGEEAGGAEKKRKKTKTTKEADLKFSKENVPSGIARSSSPLSHAIQKKMGETEVKKTKTQMRVTVFLPATDLHREPVVQFEVDDVAPAKSLIQAALNAYLRDKELAKDPIPSDSALYRIYIAEEDGEVDTDIPALDEDCTIASTGVVHFALRKRDKDTQSGYGSDIDVTLDTSAATLRPPTAAERAAEERGGGRKEEEKEKRASKSTSKKRASKLKEKLPLDVSSSTADNNKDKDGGCNDCCCTM